MKMIQCVSPKTSGILKVKAMEVEKHPREIKRILGVLPQENNLDPDFTVFKNLIVYARYYDISRKEAEKKALDLLRFVHLEEKKDYSIEKLSGGMKRRLMLARALINDPEIMDNLWIKSFALSFSRLEYFSRTFLSDGFFDAFR